MPALNSLRLMSVGLIAIESPRNRLYELPNDYHQKAAPYVEGEDYDYGRKVQREATKIQRRNPAPDGQYYGIDHCPDGVVDHLKEPRRRVAGEPADQDPRDDEPEQYVKRVVHRGLEQRAHAKPEPLQEESRTQRRCHGHLASSLACSVAASTPSYTAATKPAFSIAANAAAVVPPGVVTSSRIWYAAFSLSKTPVPAMVPLTSLLASSRGMPSRTPACTRASAKSATYAGPEPWSAVAASKSCSGSSMTSPTCRKMSITAGRYASPGSFAATTVVPRPTAAHTFGITRRILAPSGSPSAISEIGTPAATLTTVLPSITGETSLSTGPTSQGLTATMSRSLVSAVSLFEETVLTPKASAKRPSRSLSTSLTMRSKVLEAERRATSEPPILPAPIMPTLSKDLKLIEERPFGEPLTLLGRDLDVARRQEKDPGRDGLYLTV